MNHGKLGLVTVIIFLAIGCATANSNENIRQNIESQEPDIIANLKIVKDIPLR